MVQLFRRSGAGRISIRVHFNQLALFTDDLVESTAEEAPEVSQSNGVHRRVFHSPDCGSGGRGFESLRPPQFVFYELALFPRSASVPKLCFFVPKLSLPSKNFSIFSAAFRISCELTMSYRR
jgi:hypothetical protein